MCLVDVSSGCVQWVCTVGVHSGCVQWVWYLKEPVHGQGMSELFTLPGS